MVSAKARIIHDCQKPKMYRWETKNVPSRTWYGKKTTKEVSFPVLISREVRWACDCGAVWHWSANQYGFAPYWSLEHRPDKWEDIEL